DEAHALGLLGADRATGEDHVERPAGADKASQPDVAAVDERHAPATAEDPESGVARGHAQVAPEGQLEAAGDGVAFHRRDDRLAEEHARRAERAGAALGDAVAAPLDHAAQIGAGAEAAARPLE